MSSASNQRVVFIFVAAITALFLILPLVLGENGYMITLDNLDSEFVYLQVLKSANLLFSTSPHAPVESVMNGLSRSYYHSEFNLVRLIFYVFPSITAYAVNGFLVRMTGFLGMLWLLRDHCLQEKKQYAAGLAFLFACMPLYTIFGITVAGLPLLLWAFLNLRKGIRSQLNWVILFLFPFYSHFALIGPFAIAYLILLGLYFQFIKRESISFFWIGLSVYTLVSLVGQYSLISSFFFNDTPSQRISWNLPVHSFTEVAGEIGKILYRGQYHVSTFLALPLYLVILSALPAEFGRKISERRLHLLLLLIFMAAIIYPVYPFVRNMLKDVFPILMAFQFSRFIFLIPLLWFVALAIALEESGWKMSYLNALIVIQCALILYSNNELKMNLLSAAGIKTDKFYFHQPSIKEFLQPSVFNEIKTYIGKPVESYRVVSLGIHPSVAQYNGFYTLDGYQNNYPLAYKTEFRNIISGELEKDESLRIFFDDWGSRCYVYSAEIWKQCKVDFDKLPEDFAIQELKMDTDQIWLMRGRYIISRVTISNAQDLDLNLEKKFSDPSSGRAVYLYRIL